MKALFGATLGGFLLAAGLYLAAGCGGTTSLQTPSQWAGIWNGAWKSNDLQRSGNFILTIEDDGDITGTMDDKVLVLTGDVTGTVRFEGDFRASADFGAGMVYALDGRLAKNADQLDMAFRITYQGKEYSGTCRLKRGSGGGASTAGSTSGGAG